MQFWYQNRRQRDARALNAAQIMGATSSAPEGTSHAESILQQLRTLNEARRTFGIHQQPCARAARPAVSPSPPPLAGYPMGPTYCASSAAAMGLVPRPSISAAQMGAGAPPPYLSYLAMTHMAHPPAYALSEEHQMLGHPAPPRDMMLQQAMMPQQPMAGYGHMAHLAPGVCGLQMAMGPQVPQPHMFQGPMVACNPHMPQHMQHMPAHPGHPGHLNTAMMHGLTPHYGAVPHHLSPNQACSPDAQQPYPMGPHPVLAMAVTARLSEHEQYPHPHPEMTLGCAPPHDV